MFHFRIYKPSISAVLENILKLSKSKQCFFHVLFSRRKWRHIQEFYAAENCQFFLYFLVFGWRSEKILFFALWNSWIVTSNPSIWTVYERSLTYIGFLYPKSYFWKKIYTAMRSWSLELSLTHNPNQKHNIARHSRLHVFLTTFRLILYIKTPLFVLTIFRYEQ